MAAKTVPLSPTMRSMWSGSITFGLVSAPIRLFTATQLHNIELHMVRKTDGSRIKMRRFADADGEETPFSNIAKGHELPGGGMVMLTDTDLESLPVPAAKEIRVESFTPAEQVDPVLYDKTYFVAPEPAGHRAYILIRDALEASDAVGVARVAIRSRESLGVLRVRDGVILLSTLLWHDELRKPDFVFLGEQTTISEAESGMALALIQSMTCDFQPEQYSDGYQVALAALIQAKADGKDVLRPDGSAEPVATPAPDMASTLAASLAAVKANTKAKKTRKAA